MPMKSMNIKIPLTIAGRMSDKGELNPMYMTDFILRHYNSELPDRRLQELSFTYTFKIDDELHKLVKLKAIEKDLPMNEFIGRLIASYY